MDQDTTLITNRFDAFVLLIREGWTGTYFDKHGGNEFRMKCPQCSRRDEVLRIFHEQPADSYRVRGR